MCLDLGVARGAKRAMSTRSEDKRAAEQRRGQRSRSNEAGSKPGSRPAARSRTRKHAERSATYALEVPREGQQPSRKSTRKSAHHAKSDTNLNLREDRRKGSPESRYRKSKARATRARGGPHG